jgi:hypothetical protein
MAKGRKAGGANLVVGGITAMLIVAWCASSAPADTLVVAGFVTTEGSAVVVRNALVVVTLGGTTGIAETDSTRTDALGRYSIVAATVADKANISVSAQGFQGAENTVEISQPAGGAPDTIRADFALRPSVAGPNDTITISGVVADAATHQPLVKAAIIAQGFAGVGGATVSDTIWSDSTGRFRALLSAENYYYASLTVEKDGYRSLDRELPTGSRNIQLDTLLLVELQAGDTVTYVVSGTVSDSLGAGIGGAIVQVRISNGATLLYEGNDTTSHLGGYYSISTKQHYSPGMLAIEVHVEKQKYFSKDTVQMLPSSTESAVINAVLFTTTLTVLNQPRMTAARSVSPAKIYSVDGRLIGPASAGARQMLAGKVLLYKRDGVSAQEVVQMR